ncbi:MAG: Arm DNA-binding domain-containing protein [Lactobacillaceae bacterium]
MASIRKRDKKWEYTIRYKEKNGNSRRKSKSGFTKKVTKFKLPLKWN